MHARLGGALALFCTITFYLCVYNDFERQRFVVVNAPQKPVAGALAVPLPDLAALDGQPVALILRITNTTSEQINVDIAVNATLIDTVRIAPNQTRRADLAYPDGGTLTGQDLVVRSEGERWSLNMLEVANIHGHSTGLLAFVIVPDAAGWSTYVELPVALALLISLVMLTATASRRIENRRLRWLAASARGLSVSLLFAVTVAPLVSDFAVLLSVRAFITCLVLAYAQELWTALSIIPTRWKYGVVYGAAAAGFVLSVTARYELHTGLTSLIYFGERFEDRVLPSVRDVPRRVYVDSMGYDGQFYAQLAVDPLLQSPEIENALDAPAYRARRILLSWTAYVFGFGRPDWILQAYVVQHLVIWLVVAVILCRWFPPASFLNLCLWVGCMFNPGMVFSVHGALPDGSGMLLLTLAVIAIENDAPRRAAWTVGIAALAKETNLLWSAVLLSPDGLSHRDWRQWCLRGVLVAGPLTAWLIYLLARDFGGEFGVRNLTLPLAGYVEHWVAVLRGEDHAGILSMISITTQAGVIIHTRAWSSAWWRAGAASVALMVLLGTPVWEGLPGTTERVVLPMAFAFHAVLPQGRWFWPLLTLGNLPILDYVL